MVASKINFIFHAHHCKELLQTESLALNQEFWEWLLMVSENIQKTTHTAFFIKIISVQDTSCHINTIICILSSCKLIRLLQTIHSRQSGCINLGPAQTFIPRPFSSTQHLPDPNVQLTNPKRRSWDFLSPFCINDKKKIQQSPVAVHTV